MSDQPFLTLVSHIQRSAARKDSHGVQLDLFVAESETLASLIVLDIVRSILDAGGNLGTMKIQMAINAARERAITLLDSQLPQHIRNSR
jgi:hypothetical protein